MIETSKVIELRTGTCTLQGIVVKSDGTHIWLAEALIFRDGIPIRDRLIRSLMRVRLASIRAFSEAKATQTLEHDYSSITALPNAGCNISVFIAGEEIKGTVTAIDPLQITDETGRTWFIPEPDVVDTHIGRSRARQLIAEASHPSPAAPIPSPPKPVALVNSHMKRFSVEYATGNDKTQISVMAETPVEAREKADNECTRNYPRALFIGMREVALNPEAAA